MFDFFGGVPRLIVPDSLKSGVNTASFYAPEVNRSCGMMAAHYGVGILPPRPRKPRNKEKVEAEVRLAQPDILGRLRHQTFFSLSDCNVAIRSRPRRPIFEGSAGHAPPRPASGQGLRRHARVSTSVEPQGTGYQDRPWQLMRSGKNGLSGALDRLQLPPASRV